MNELYETKISDAQWWAFDIPGNVGWILWLVCWVLCLRRGLTLHAALAALPGAFMLLGVGELVSERIKGLDRVLPRKRVLRGFGALTLGGALGAAAALFALAAGAGENGTLTLLMLCGGVLCAVFAALCYRGYRPKESGGR